MDGDILKQYIDKIQKAPEQEIIREIDSLKWSFRIFHGNYHELIIPLKLIEDRPEAIRLWDVKRKKDLYNVFEEIGRLLFNYLSAASMLIDHTRRHIDKLYKAEKYAEFKKEYEKESNNNFANNDIHQIAKGLRNYIQHRNLPAVGSQITYTQETGLNKAFTISTESLLKWDKWSTSARKKLETMGKSFQLRKFVEDYFSQVESFYEWLWVKQVELHQEDVEQLNKLKAEARIAFKNAGIITEDELRELDNS
jgi:hypothetical protein